MNLLKIKFLEIEGQLIIRAESSAYGESEESQPFEKNRGCLSFCNASGSTLRSIEFSEKRAKPRPSMKVLGKQLFDLIFIGDIYGIYRAHLSLESKTILQLDLSSAPSLINLPWEVLYDYRRNNFIGLSGKVYPVRYLSLPVATKDVESKKDSLSVLVVISHENDLEVEEEWINIQKLFGNSVTKNIIKLNRLEDVSYKGLQDNSLSFSPDIVHFIGHGEFDEFEKSASLRLRSKSGNIDYISADDLGNVLGAIHNLKLLVLNSCQGSLTASDDMYIGMSHRLLQLGVPSVISMQNKISDSAAIIFSERLYHFLLSSLPLEMAVTEARKSIFKVSDEKNWYLPVLYTRSVKNTLFDFESHLSFSEIYQLNKPKLNVLFCNVAVIILSSLFILYNVAYKRSQIIVYDENSRSIPEAKVTISAIDFQGETDAEGKVSVAFFLPENKSTSVRVEKKGFSPITAKLHPGAILYERLHRKD